MARLVVLDSGPLGALCNTVASPLTRRTLEWAAELAASGVRLVVVEIADYEVRRELIRANKVSSITRLDDLGASFGYHGLRTASVRLAAELWAEARNRGLPTADRHALDADVLLAAQVRVLAASGHECVVATTKPGHLSRYVDARPWDEIT